MGWEKTILASILILAGLFSYTGLQGEEIVKTPLNFQDNYPAENGWTANGTLTNLTDNSGTLQVSSGADSGTFQLTEVDKKLILDFEQVIIDANTDKQNPSYFILTSYNEENAVVGQENFTIEEGRQSYDLSLLRNQTSTSYDFTIELKGSAEASYVSVEGTQTLQKTSTETSG